MHSTVDFKTALRTIGIGMAACIFHTFTGSSGSFTLQASIPIKKSFLLVDSASYFPIPFTYCFSAYLYYLLHIHIQRVYFYSTLILYCIQLWLTNTAIFQLIALKGKTQFFGSMWANVYRAQKTHAHHTSFLRSHNLPPGRYSFQVWHQQTHYHLYRRITHQSIKYKK